MHVAHNDIHDVSNDIHDPQRFWGNGCCHHSPKIALRVHLLDAMKTGASSTGANGGPHEEIFLNINSYCSFMLENAELLVFSELLVWRYLKNQRIYQEKSSSGPWECLKHREYCFTLLEDSHGEIFGEWIIDLDGLCIWQWYEVHSKYLQNSFVYLSSRHVAGFWRLVLSSSWIASYFRNHCAAMPRRYTATLMVCPPCSNYK